MRGAFWVLGLVLAFAPAARADVIYTESSRSGALMFKLGMFNPSDSIDEGLPAKPYETTFGDTGMLVGEIEYDHYFYQGFGAVGIGASGSYGEIYGKGLVIGDETATTEDHSGLVVAPVRLMALYNWDYAAQTWAIPLVPYLRAGAAVVPWWALQAGNVEIASGKRGAGATWGWTVTGGLMFQLDVLDPRLARDFDNDLGVNHSYVFAEYNYLRAENFGKGGLKFNVGHFMFGLSLEF
ncbi:MAG: hypothetical protein IRZ16_09950 [Myxococcaceae bacterium]|nr:hypothetical protein [Myxococcaceae bacterium]